MSSQSRLLPSRLLMLLLGFGAGFYFAVLQPVFLNAQRVMLYEAPVPLLKPIGIDLVQMLSYCTSWWINGLTPYIGNNLYPPLATVLFTPLVHVAPETAYAVVTALSLLSFIYICLVAPLRYGGAQALPAVLLCFVTGLFSYGFQFEIERGQFNLMSLALAVGAADLFHSSRKPGMRFLAYLLFTLAVQLKVYPVLLGVLLIEDWRDWKTNSKRALLLALVNTAALFILGAQTCKEFLHAIHAQMSNPYIWIGNHSIHAFVIQLRQFRPDLAVLSDATLKLLLLLLSLSAVGWVAVLSPILRKRIDRGAVIAACIVTMMVVPSVSHDYKLALLPAALAFFVARPPERERGSTVLIGSGGYALTTFFYTVLCAPQHQRPGILWQNALPSLLYILFLITLATILERPRLSPVLAPSEDAPPAS